MKRLGIQRATQDHQLSSSELADIPEDEPIKCERCQDSGIVHPLKENGRPNYGLTVPCRYCITTEDIRRYLGVSSMDATFDNWKPTKGSEDALKAAMLLSSLKTSWKLLLVMGTWGNGKTHLLEATSIALWHRGIIARVKTFPDFMGKLKSTFDRVKDSTDSTFRDIMDEVCTTPYLLLDDVGAAGSFTPFSLEQLERIMLSRYRDNLFTFITTNLDLKNIPEFVTSRFSDSEKGRIVLNESSDYRPSKAKMRSTLPHGVRKPS